MRPEVEENDKFGIELIKHIFDDKKGKTGARTIKMVLLRDFAVIMNLKKDQVYSTDITSLNYGKNQRAYLSAV